MATKRVTQQDIASQAGVNRATVSMALKGHPNIPIKTRDRIRDIAKALGYAPDPMLSALNAYRNQLQPTTFHGTLAWFINSAFGFNWRDLKLRPHFNDYYLGACERAARFGFKVEIFDLNSKGMTPLRLAAIFRARGVAGILLCPQPRPETILEFPWHEFSSITFGYSLSEPRLHTVAATQYRSTRETVTQLHKLGYQRIGLALHDEHDARSDHNYLAGYLVEEFLAGRPTVVPPLTSAYDQPQKVQDWLKAHRPDAVITGNYHFLDSLIGLKLKVPAQLGVACPLLPADNCDLAGVVEDGLEIGGVAVEFLVGMIHRQERGIPRIPQRIHVEGRWHFGKTLRSQLS